MANIDLALVSNVFSKFTRTDLGETLSSIESAVKGLSAANCSKALSDAGVSSEVLAAAAALKRLAGQVNVAIHATGILLCLPYLLKPGEAVEYVSLGAGNTGREFDLETNHRVAEFKFIHWRGGAESIRQNQLFKDFYLLAESPTPKRKYLYVLGTEMPLRFLNGGRKLDSVLSRNVKLPNDLRARHGSTYQKVREYYSAHRHLVAIEDVSRWVPELVAESAEIDEESEPT
jgi:HAMP domain-containing protein